MVYGARRANRLIHPKGVFQPGHVPFLASVRHFCIVSRDVFFVSSLIPSRAYFVSCLIPSEIADFADGKTGVLVTAGAALSFWIRAACRARVRAREADTRTRANG